MVYDRLITKGKLPPCLFMILKTTTCVSINPTVLHCTFNWGKDRQGLRVTEKKNKNKNRKQDVSQISFIPQMFAEQLYNGLCKSIENMSLSPKSLLFIHGGKETLTTTVLPVGWPKLC